MVRVDAKQYNTLDEVERLKGVLMKINNDRNLKIILQYSILHLGAGKFDDTQGKLIRYSSLI